MKKSIAIVTFLFILFSGLFASCGNKTDDKDNHEGQIHPPKCSSEYFCSDCDYREVRKEFEDAGFVNITMVAEPSHLSYGEVQEVTINGHGFKDDKWFNPEDEVVIEYYAYAL